MTLRKRPDGTLFIDLRTADGKRLRKATGTRDREQARKLHNQIEAELWEREHLARHTVLWEEAVTAWLRERGEYPSREDDIRWLRWLDPHLRGRELESITYDTVRTIRQAKEAEGVKPRTVNAVLQVVRSVLRFAQQNGWVLKIPPIRLLADPSRRVRVLTEEEERRLLAELPEHEAEITRFALATGLRMSNITGLEWSQVDLGRRVAWIHADQAKARRAIAVPLNAAAVEVLLRQVGKNPDRVFVWRGRPIAKVNGRAWRAALRRAGVPDFRFHDLRHTWASRHVAAGTPLHALQALGGWEDPAMVQRYAHFSAGHLQEYAEGIVRPAAAGGGDQPVKVKK